MSTKLLILIAVLGVAAVTNAVQPFHRCQCCEDDPPPQCSRLFKPNFLLTLAGNSNFEMSL